MLFVYASRRMLPTHYKPFILYARLFSSLLITIKAITQTITDTRDPVAVASPIGNSVVGKSFEVRYTPGTRTNKIAMMLCRNDNPDFPQAQK